MRCFRANASKVLSERTYRRHLRAKSVQLRVMQVAAGVSPQHCLRQESLSPQRDETAGVKILGVYGPQAHVSHPLRPHGVLIHVDHRAADHRAGV
jgi:hypothetical protein